MVVVSKCPEVVKHLQWFYHLALGEIMANNQSTMTEFTFAPGEKDVVGEHFSPNVLLFWLKTAVAASNTRVQYRSPNTILGLIPLGAETQTIPLRNIASVNTSTKFNMGSFLFGIIFIIAGLATFGSSAVGGLILLILGIANIVNMMSAKLDFVNQAGGKNSVMVSILEKDKLAHLSQSIQERIFADMEGIRHQESMNMQQQQFTVQAQQAMLQQQMLDAQRAAAQQSNGATAPTTPINPIQ